MVDEGREPGAAGWWVLGGFGGAEGGGGVVMVAVDWMIDGIYPGGFSTATWISEASILEASL